ncbi:hypothetical protein [Tepidibacter thalassicus]|uniref:Uncharacterized protein n=1 Tax=Tepidibacter thalassicus DSM 15285 TaxID=1123350 RepID=A0A1M5TXE9_9FIRM|nr:hypothetical protein [Tepidibacter thalassicus]SHH55374.1 hypothetical protein SAMN02744040_02329 [Tepidibacter thalassicus DSM 15285]
MKNLLKKILKELKEFKSEVAKMLNKYISKYILLSLALFSFIWLIIIYSKSYNATVHIAKALPISIVNAASLIAFSIYTKNSK